MEPLSRNNIVYKINCRDCKSTYVGQTKRNLKTRVKEHQNNINKKTGNLSVISEYRLEKNHDFEWEIVEGK